MSGIKENYFIMPTHCVSQEFNLISVPKCLEPQLGVLGQLMMTERVEE